MDNLIITLPKDNWFTPNGAVKPTDKMLCIVLFAYGNQTPAIMQYREKDWLYTEEDYFLDVSEKWTLDEYDGGDEWEPGFATWDIISKWKPLSLPEDDNKRITDDIEQWFCNSNETNDQS